MDSGRRRNRESGYQRRKRGSMKVNIELKLWKKYERGEEEKDESAS